MVVAISALILWLSGASVSSEQLFSETENRPDSTVTVPETVDTLVEYSYKAVDSELYHTAQNQSVLLNPPIQPYIDPETSQKCYHIIFY